MAELLAMLEDFAVPYLETVENATAEERSAAIDKYGNYAAPDILSINDEGTEASIAISGPLSPNGPSPIARFFGFGGTAYKDVIESAQLITDDPAIRTVNLNMDTPGGTVAGMDAARQAIEALTAAGKTVVAHNLGMIASAGYYLATAATRIEASGPLALTGSIGVIITGFDASKAMEKAGIKRVVIVSRHAPNKAPDPATEEGLALVQAEADAMERVFIAKAAEGRGTTTEDVIENFGKGGMLLAQDPDENMPDALKVGMIDAIIGVSAVSSASSTNAAEGGGQPTGASKMDLNQLKAEHPALYAEAVSVGATQERERVEAHATMGEASGDMELALACIKDGSEPSAKVQSQHFAAGMKKHAKDSRTSETEPPIDPAVDDAVAHEAALAAAVAESLGVETDA